MKKEEYYKKLKDDKKEKQRIWRLNNKEKVNGYSREWARNHPENSHKHKLKNRYGLSLEEYNQKLKDQGGVCAICGKPETKISKGKLQYLSVDHCHKTGTNRGLLCDNCNKTLGNVEDSQETLLKAIHYLRTWITNG